MVARLRVLMVCTGNICRSPTAQGVLRHRLGVVGLAGQVEVDSAGTRGYHAGEAPDPRAQRHAARRGYDLSGLRARAVVSQDFHRFDWILAADADNLGRLAAMRPEGSPARLGLLMEHARRFPGVLELPDPYYGPPEAFERVLDLVEDACEGFLAGLGGQ